MRRLSLRWMLLGAVLGAITLAFTVFALYLDRVEQASRLDDIDAELVRAERAGTGPPQPNGPGGAPPPAVVDEVATLDTPIQLVIDADGTVVADSGGANPFDPAVLASLAGRTESVTTSDPRYRVRTTAMPDERTAVTALPLDGFDTAVERYREALVVGGGVILVIVAALLWVLTGWLTRPLTRMAGSARRIAAGDLDTPVSSPAGSREASDLAADLDLMVTQLRTSIGEANESRDTTERLLADLAHEVRTPLTALKGYSDLYAKGMLETTADVDRAMARIGSESERLNSLANTMLQLAGAPAEAVAYVSLDLAGLTADVVADLRAAYPDQELEVVVDRRGSFEVRGSRPRLHQALVNLGSNACHHTAPGTTIVVGLGCSPGEVHVRFSDRGPGVDLADRDRIFLPFYRSDAGRSRDGHHGAGLGLALVHQIAEQHHGTVSVEGNPGGGATFVLCVPAEQG